MSASTRLHTTPVFSDDEEKRYYKVTNINAESRKLTCLLAKSRLDQDPEISEQVNNYSEAEAAGLMSDLAATFSVSRLQVAGAECPGRVSSTSSEPTTAPGSRDTSE